MASPTQVRSNRRNAALSTGPRTPAGKAGVRLNAVSHGLSSAHAVLAHEDRAAFDEMLNALFSEFTPRGEHERFLVQQMAESRWRLARLRRLEAAVFNSMLGDAGPDSADARLAEAFMNKGGDALEKLQRYQSAIERSYYKAHKELTAGRKALVSAAKPGVSDTALLDMLMRVPDYKTNPNPMEDVEMEDDAEDFDKEGAASRGSTG